MANYSTQCRKCGSYFQGNTSTMLCYNCLEKELQRLRDWQTNFGASARTIALWLQEYCDEKLTYSEMIAEAARRAEAEIEKLRNNLYIERKINIMFGEWIDNEEMELLDVCPSWCECYGENPCSFQLEWNARKQIQTPEEVYEWSKRVNCPDCKVKDECTIERKGPCEKAGDQT